MLLIIWDMGGQGAEGRRRFAPGGSLAYNVSLVACGL